MRSCSVPPGREQTGSPQDGLPFAFFAGVFNAPQNRVFLWLI